jgi:hypothetical protein
VGLLCKAAYPGIPGKTFTLSPSKTHLVVVGTDFRQFDARQAMTPYDAPELVVHKYHTLAISLEDGLPIVETDNIERKGLPAADRVERQELDQAIA